MDIRDFFNVFFEVIFLIYWYYDYIYGFYKFCWMVMEIEFYVFEGQVDVLIFNELKNLKLKILKFMDRIKIDILKIIVLKFNYQVEIFGYLIEEDGKSFVLFYDIKGFLEEIWQVLRKKVFLRGVVVDVIYLLGFNDFYYNNVDEVVEIGFQLVERIVLSYIFYKNLFFFEFVEYVRKRWGNKVLVVYDGMVFYV